jgi:hypothetical protein
LHVLDGFGLVGDNAGGRMPRMPSTTFLTGPGVGLGDGEGPPPAPWFDGGGELPLLPLLPFEFVVVVLGAVDVAPLPPPPGRGPTGATASTVPVDGTPVNNASMARPVAVASVPTRRATTAHDPPCERKSVACE